MSVFKLYFNPWLQHIADLKGYDHILFIVAVIILLTLLIVDLFHYARREWFVLLSGAGLGISLALMIERYPVR